MRYLKDRFGFDEIKLTGQEKHELLQNLRQQDQKRIEFFATVSLFTTSIFILLDVIDFYGNHQLFYLVVDLVLLLVSAIIVVAEFWKYFSNHAKRLTQATVAMYPIICILWATVIATLNPDSLLNMFTFYIVFFLISFFLSPDIIKYTSYFITYLLAYFALNIVMDTKIFNETLILFLIGSTITIPFYTSFRSTRKNSLSALIKLNRSNQSLEFEVIEKIDELRVTNEELNNEIEIRKVVEEKLRLALQKAEQSDQLKSEFLANISHEIRTPLNAIIGFTEMLTEDGVNSEQKKEFQKLVGSNTMFLLSTIDDIFDASLVSTHQINAINAPLLVNKFLESLFYEATGIALKYNFNTVELIKCKLPDDATTIVSDEYYLKKALLKLIDNAYKFTPKGSVEVGAKLLAGKIEFYVKDTGISINEQDKEKIFQPFVQGDGSYTRDFGGVGLGLSIVMGIVAELDGELKMDSKIGVGSVFKIELKY